MEENINQGTGVIKKGRRSWIIVTIIVAILVISISAYQIEMENKKRQADIDRTRQLVYLLTHPNGSIQGPYPVSPTSFTISIIVPNGVSVGDCRIEATHHVIRVGSETSLTVFGYEGLEGSFDTGGSYFNIHPSNALYRHSTLGPESTSFTFSQSGNMQTNLMQGYWTIALVYDTNDWKIAQTSFNF